MKNKNQSNMIVCNSNYPVQKVKYKFYKIKT